jgi:hypothetical protein
MLKSKSGGGLASIALSRALRLFPRKRESSNLIPGSPLSRGRTEKMSIRRQRHPGELPMIPGQTAPARSALGRGPRGLARSEVLMTESRDNSCPGVMPAEVLCGRWTIVQRSSALLTGPLEAFRQESLGACGKFDDLRSNLLLPQVTLSL